MLEDSTGSTLLLIFVLLLVIFAAYFTTRYLSVKGGNLMKSKYMLVKDRVVLAKDKQIVLLQVGTKHIVVGITPQAMQQLGTVEEGELQPVAQEPPQTDGSVQSFKEVLAKIYKKDGNLPK